MPQQLLRIVILITLEAFILTLPGLIMKYKKKQDQASKSKKTASIVAATFAYFLSGAFVLIEEQLFINYVLLVLILMLSAIIVIVDTRCRIIPNICLFPMLIISAGYLIYNTVIGAEWVNIVFSIISMIMMCVGLIALTAALHFQGYLGAGDIKYLSVGAFLFGFSDRIVGMLAGIVISMAAYLIPMFIAKKLTMKSFIAFGPFIGFGMMCGICWQYFL